MNDNVSYQKKFFFYTTFHIQQMLLSERFTIILSKENALALGFTDYLLKPFDND